MYGTPPEPRFFDELIAHPKTYKYQQAYTDPSIFHRHSAHGTIITGVSMDYFLFIATDETVIDELFKELQRNYKIKRLGFPQQHLNCTIKHFDVRSLFCGRCL